MVVFTRRSHESVIVGGPADLERVLRLTVLEVHGDRVKIGVDVSDQAVGWQVWQQIRGPRAGEPASIKGRLLPTAVRFDVQAKVA